VHSVNGCLTNIPGRSCSELQATLLSTSVLERINTSSALPWLLNRTALYRYSPTWTYLSLYDPTTNTGLPYCFLLGRRRTLTCCLAHSAINLFSSSRPITKGQEGSEESWVEKTYFTTEEAFPTVLRRSEIIAVEVVEISPIERVLNEVEDRTKELEGLCMKYSTAVKTGQSVSTNPLTMALNTAVDAPQENGVPSFRHFLSNEYIMRNPDKLQIVERLRIAIDDHVRVYILR